MLNFFKCHQQLIKIPIAVTCALALSCCSTAALAANVSYTGNATDLTAKPPNVAGSGSDTGLVPVNGGLHSHSNNQVVIDFVASGSAIPKFVLGGFAAESSFNTPVDLSAAHNQIRFNQGEVDGALHGGMVYTSSTGNASVSATATATATVNSNIINLHGNTAVRQSLYGGYATAEALAYASPVATANSSASTVNIHDNASIAENLYGGYAATTALVITNAPASSTGTAAATSTANAVNIHHQAAVRQNLYGGYATAVTTGYVIPGVAGRSTAMATAVANTNSVGISHNAVVTENLYGGYATVRATAYDTASSIAIADASHNTVTINDHAGIQQSLYGGFAYAFSQASASATATGAATATVTANTVNINGSAIISADLYGGHADAMVNAYDTTSATISTAATANTVNIKDTTLVAGNLFGGRAGIVTDTYDSTRITASVTASHNTVNIHHLATVNGNLHGGYAASIDDTNVTATTITTAEAMANTVSLHDSAVVTGSIYGGFVNVTGNATALTASATANTVNLHDQVRLSANSSIYGGRFTGNPTAFDVFSGNTLNFSAQPVSVQKLANFEYYKFTLTPSLANTGTALITAQEIELGATPANISNGATTPSKITVVGILPGKALNAGDQFILMKAVNSLSGNGSGGIDNITQAQQGISLLYDVKTQVNAGDKTVTATIVGCWLGTGGICRVNPQLKALAEGYLAGSQLVLRGADLIADDAFHTISEQNQRAGFAPFVLLSAQHNRYNSGSHIDSSDFLLTGGVSYQRHNLTAGVLVEGGWGNHDTYNSFYNAASVHGDGDDRYYGLGMLGRYAFSSGFYTDASARFGRHRNEFNTTDIQNLITGEFARYTVNSNYVSAHLGAGYLLPLDEQNSLDLSAKYLWTRLDGKDVTVAGDAIHFDRVDSQRARLKATLNHQYSDRVALNAGLGYEYEFDGKVNATTLSIYRIDAPSVKGTTGIASIGAQVKPTADQRFSLDFKLNGYTGKREGVGISGKVDYAF